MANKQNLELCKGENVVVNRRQTFDCAKNCKTMTDYALIRNNVKHERKKKLLPRKLTIHPTSVNITDSIVIIKTNEKATYPTAIGKPQP